MWSQSLPTGICSMSPLTAVCCLLLGTAFTIKPEDPCGWRYRSPTLFDPEGADEHWLTTNIWRVFTRNLNHYAALKQLRPDLVPLLIGRMHPRWPNSNTFSFWENDETWVEERFSDFNSREGERVDDTDGARGREPVATTVALPRRNSA